jgi:hypothetical protein
MLKEAGLDREMMREMTSAGKKERKEHRTAVHVALEANDYAAFVAGAPDFLVDAVNSAADFSLFVEAAELKEAGDREGARVIVDELGIEQPEGGKHSGNRGSKGGRGNR